MSESTELQRSIDNLTRAVERLEEQLVRKDVYESDQRGLNREIVALKAGITGLENQQEKAEERRAADRRLVLTSFALPLLLLLLQLYVAAQTGGGS